MGKGPASLSLNTIYNSFCLTSLGSHYNDVIMNTMASHITSLTILYSIVYLSADLRKHQSSTLLVFVWEIHRRPVNSPHKGPVTRKIFPFDDVIMVRFEKPAVCFMARSEARFFRGLGFVVICFAVVMITVPGEFLFFIYSFPLGLSQCPIFPMLVK